MNHLLRWGVGSEGGGGCAGLIGGCGEDGRVRWSGIPILGLHAIPLGIFLLERLKEGGFWTWQMSEDGTLRQRDLSAARIRTSRFQLQSRVGRLGCEYW
jgi:hypothetical protein